MPRKRPVATTAQIVLDMLIRAKLGRVKDASSLKEYERRKGRTRLCRVCLLGAAQEAQIRKLISREEYAGLLNEIVKSLEANNDFASELNTVPDTRAMRRFFRAIADGKPWQPGAKK